MVKKTSFDWTRDVYSVSRISVLWDGIQERHTWFWIEPAWFVYFFFSWFCSHLLSDFPAAQKCICLCEFALEAVMAGAYPLMEIIYFGIEDATRTEGPQGSVGIWNRNPSLPFTSLSSLFFSAPSIHSSHHFDRCLVLALDAMSYTSVLHLRVASC